IGAPHDRKSVARARTLFASVLDCPGGGLRIDTIHAFSQWLLGAFPLEAELIPGTRPMEDHERVILARQVLADLLVKAESEPLGDPQLLASLENLSLRMGPDDVEAYLLRCANAREAWLGPGGWQEPMRPNVLRLLGLPADADESQLAEMCSDEVFDTDSLRRCLQTLEGWVSATGQDGSAAIAIWLGLDSVKRAETIDDLHSGLFTKTTDAPRQLKNILKRDPDYEGPIESVRESIAAVRNMQNLLALVDRLVPALRLGRAFALAWDEAKQREGLIDFDDQIRRAAELLNRSELADWIRYKLDRRFDHILVDEAQDTNESQWQIILEGLTSEFFTGLGQRDNIMRTLFVVGDYKQAIFRFQGTSPENFEAARRRVREAMAGAVENARGQRSNFLPRPLREYGLDRSFRTAQKVLDFVDQAIGHIGHESFGLDAPSDPHKGEDRPGYVALWRPVGWIGEGEDQDDAEEGDETWLSKPDRQLAEKISQQVKAWVDTSGEGYPLVKGGKRRAGPGDILVLVRKRRELAGLIVARLHAAGVPVAGVDRLRLGAPLSVRDLVSALRFAAQPLDDLNLAGLLVSPLIGWSQEQLLEHAYREKGVHLWNHLRRSSHADVAALQEQLGQLLRIADFEPPQAMLHWLLTGPWLGRRKLVARLGHEANDPIDELVNAAHAYTATATPSLAGFLHWFDAGEGELKREAGNSGGLVRVMTVHGAKGLQSPIVILADATGNPDASRVTHISMPDPAAPEHRSIPLPSLRKEEQAGRIAGEFEKSRIAEQQEHWRLLYVAMTRAEEALFITGALGSRAKGVPPEGSWYATLREMFGTGSEVVDSVWSGRLDWGEPPEPMAGNVSAEELPLPVPLPPWLEREPPAEPRPPKPLAPSSLGEEDAADPPYPPGAGEEAARRGTLVHKLLERLPEVPEADRHEGGLKWLELHAGDFSAEQRREMLGSALEVITTEEWAGLFGTGSLAEVPIAAVVDDRVVAGTIDRLVITPDRIRLVDYKTSRRPPGTIDEVPRAILRQMAAYAAALEATYPGRSVEAALLYTTAPRLIVIPEDVLAHHKQALSPAQ
ncbi:MAG: UvrD-helicase domain-containing protein, partial [Novosphingobium sp.]|nr:UvrD-helicase domain-containing protein [Novosphingobium sp.]